MAWSNGGHRDRTPKPATLIGPPDSRRRPRLLGLVTGAILLVAASSVTGFALGHSAGATSAELTETADEIGSELTSNLPPVQPNVSFTADTDPNKLLGRPNGYISKTSFTDSRIKPNGHRA